jgi:hypothetical protein
VNSLKAKRILEADPPRFGWRDETKIADEEDPALVDFLSLDALQLVGKKRRTGYLSWIASTAVQTTERS